MKRCLCPSAERKGPFTWKEDDPKARIILESSFGLHAKMRLCYVEDLCSAWLQSKMAGDNDKSRVLGLDNCLSASICHYHNDISKTATANYEQQH